MFVVTLLLLPLVLAVGNALDGEYTDGMYTAIIVLLTVLTPIDPL